MGFLLCTVFTGVMFGQSAKDDIKKVAAQFIEGADLQKGDMLEQVLEPNSQQYVVMKGKFSTFSAKQYVEMVNAKKLGGKPRKITYRHAEVLGDNIAVVVLNAVSSEYNFLYQLSLAKADDNKWQIVGITGDIKGAHE